MLGAELNVPPDHGSEPPTGGQASPPGCCAVHDRLVRTLWLHTAW
jgi:hypothetical protein